MKKIRKQKARMNFSDLESVALKKIFRMVRFTVFCFFLSLIQVMAVDSYSQMTKLSLNANNEPLENVLETIEAESEFFFLYNKDLIDVEQKVNIDVENETIKLILNGLLKGKDISYAVYDRQIVLSNIATINEMVAQQKSVTGTVTDSNNQPLVGVTVVVKGTTTGGITNMDGKYSLINIPDDATLIFSFIGMRTREVVVGNQTSIDVMMEEEAIGLEDVVVTALGIKRQEKVLGYAVQKVKGEDMIRVKGIDAATNLTGRVSGLTVNNSSEFYDAPRISLRGATPLLIVDGVPFVNVSLANINQDDILSIDVLKGATASALYGSRGGSGAIMITTKKGTDKSGFSVDINSSSLMFAGYLALPEVQTSYSSGSGGKFDNDDWVWGDKLDIGRTADQWDPALKERRDMPLISKGKDNLQHFMNPSYILNNSISISQTGENGSFRTSFSNVYNRGQYPNTKLKKYSFTVGGDIKVGDKFTLDANIMLNKNTAPNTLGYGYSEQGYIYSLLVWTGPDYDIREFQDYWIVPDEKQNWHYTSWYDNLYVTAYEKLNTIDDNVINGYIAGNYSILPWLKMIFRSGLDMYVKSETRQSPIVTLSSKEFDANGYYHNKVSHGFSSHNDLIFNFDKQFNKFSVGGLVGGTIFYMKANSLGASTNDGISIPGFYSLKASVNPVSASSSLRRKQVNSLYAKARFGYNDLIYIDVTARNDWSSTLPESERSYFYPSVAGSLILSEIFELPEWIDFWKIRGSWTIAKSDLGIFATNYAYSTSVGTWDNQYSTASYPSSLKSGTIEPVKKRTYEVGTSINFVQNRLHFDFAYYNQYISNRAVSAPIGRASGFTSALVNTNETLERRGLEFSLNATPVKRRNVQWNILANFSNTHQYYKELDEQYSADRLWVKEGGRTDAYATSFYQRDPDGNLIHFNGRPSKNPYTSSIGYSGADWVWGLSNVVNYKNWTFTVSADGRIGGLMSSRIDRDLTKTGAHPDLDIPERYDEVVNGNITFVGEGVMIESGSVEFDPHGTIISDTRVFVPNNVPYSVEAYYKKYRGGRWALDPTFLKIREMSLSYELPAAAAAKIKAKAITVGLVGQNLYLWTKEFRYSDPDRGFTDLNSPTNRYLGINVKLSF